MKKWLYLSIISFFLSSMTIWFMPQKSLQLILAAVFWLGLIAGFLFQLPISKARKADRKYREKPTLKRFRVFSNKPAIAADVVFLVSVVVAIVGAAVTKIPDIVPFGGVFGIVFSLEMHGIFNGRSYEWLEK